MLRLKIAALSLLLSVSATSALQAQDKGQPPIQTQRADGVPVQIGADWVSEPVVPTDKHATTVIDPGVIGVPEGVPDGLRLDGGVLNAANLDRVPRALAQIPPRYPAEARMKGLSGEVVVEFNVDESGNVSSVRVVRSSSREFDAAALAAVRKWRFEPGRRHGRIVRFSMVVPVVFRLNA